MRLVIVLAVLGVVVFVLGYLVGSLVAQRHVARFLWHMEATRREKIRSVGDPAAAVELAGVVEVRRQFSAVYKL